MEQVNSMMFLSTVLCVLSLSAFKDSTEDSLNDSNQKCKPPSFIMYLSSVDTVGKLSKPNSPIISGTIEKFFPLTLLPLGLAIDTKTGEISGAPISATPKTTYKIKGYGCNTDVLGFITITVIEAKPGPISYLIPDTCYINKKYSFNVSTKGVIETFSGILPPEFDLNEFNGTMTFSTNTPGKYYYEVIAKNCSGKDSTKGIITVCALKPKIYSVKHIVIITGENFRVFGQQRVLYDSLKLGKIDTWSDTQIINSYELDSTEFRRFNIITQ